MALKRFNRSDDRDPVMGCKAGPPYVCPSNNVACATMVCDPVLNACKPVPSGVGSCDINSLTDETKCKPCTQVQACLNTCAYCELCIGKPTLPPDCVGQTCPGTAQPCGLPGQAPCPTGFSCITGCCVANPN